MRRISSYVAIIVVFCALTQTLLAQGSDITITWDKNRKAPVDLSGINVQGSAGDLFKKTLAGDLKRSGWFSISKAGMGVVTVSGNATETKGKFQGKLAVVNVANGRSYLSKKYQGRSVEIRKLAHQVADDIVWAVKGVKGIATSRIVMIGSRGGKKDVYTCDADGGSLANQTPQDKSLATSPTWWPDGKSLIYTSYRSGFPDVYKLDLFSRQIVKIAGFPGLNAGADISPDGRMMALTLSMSGNPELYVIDLRTGKQIRLTATKNGSEASPSWSPDGKSIVYVSDTSGAPQLYVISINGSKSKRITFQGSQNVTPDWGPNGTIVYSSRRSRKFQVCVIQPDGRNGLQLTSEHADHQEPSWAPDGRHIVFAKELQFHSDLYILDTLGDPSVRLTSIEGDWYSPDWLRK